MKTFILIIIVIGIIYYGLKHLLDYFKDKSRCNNCIASKNCKKSRSYRDKVKKKS